MARLTASIACAIALVGCGRVSYERDTDIADTGGGGMDAAIPECVTDTDCDDGTHCNGVETCVEGTCAPGSPIFCDDGVACTHDGCSEAEGGCASEADDARCTAAAEGRCDVELGCQYPVCNAETCTADPCQTAECSGDVCIRTSVCAGDQICCGGRCEPAGCDDENPCTNDACGAEGCVHENNANPCSDGNACTVGDVCFGGVCVAEADRICVDGDLCTIDSCDPLVGCVFPDASCVPVLYECVPAVSGNEVNPAMILNSDVWPGFRFEVPAGSDVQTTHIRLNAQSTGGGTFFGAIVRLTDASDIPDSLDLTGSDVVAATTITLPPSATSTSETAPITVVLSPGWYAAVFGAGALGAPDGSALVHFNSGSGGCGMGYGFPFSIRPSLGEVIAQAATPHFQVQAQRP